MLKRIGLAVIVTALCIAGYIAPVSAQGGIVHAVFFYSPTCSHCHVVMTEVLPVLQAEYGDKLVIVQLDTTQPGGNALWQAAVSIFQPAVVGVPTMVIGDKIMVGSREIPEMLPAYIDQYLQSGGVDWPALPGIEAVVADLEGVEPDSPSLAERFSRDLAGNSLAVIVLVGLILTFVAVLKPRPWQARFAQRFGSWGLYLVIAVGLIAALYLAYVETTQSEAICGPIGDCNAVQQSDYALLFGFLPIAVLGVIGYVGILAVTLYGKYSRGPFIAYAPALSFLLTIFGLAFSTYLTFLEPFVIGATCAWCLTSAVCMLLLALMSADAGWQSLRQFAADMRKAA